MVVEWGEYNMIKSLVQSYNENKANIKNDLRELVDTGDYFEYIDIVKILFSNIMVENQYGYNDNFDVGNITHIDNGHYQGTDVYLIPRDTYQPSVYDYCYTHNNYGSCSGCDLLLSIIEFRGEDDIEEILDDLMSLCLNLIQRTHKMYE